MVDILSTINRNGSGLNITELASSLANAEVQPKITAAERRKSATEASISGMGQLRAQLAKVTTAITTLDQQPILSASVTGQAATLAVTDRAKISEGTTEISVQSVAARQVLEFTGFSSATAPLGAGQITVDFGEWTNPATGAFSPNAAKPAQTLTVPVGATLEDVAAALDRLEGVTARIVEKGDGTFSLGINSETGSKNAIRIGVTETPGNPGLAAMATTAGNIGTLQTQAAANAVVKIDGLTITRETNRIDNLVDGISLNLTQPGDTKITFARDKETAAANLQFLAETLNETFALASSLGNRGAIAGSVKGALAGDNGLESLVSRLKTLVNAPIGGHGSRAFSLSDMGLGTQRDGSLRFDRTAFDAAFAADPAIFDAAFTDTLTSLTDGAGITGTPSTTAESGVYRFERAPDGSATLGGRTAFGADIGNGRFEYFALGGPMLGLSVQVDAGVNSAEIRFGKSFLTLLQGEIDKALASDGTIGARETQLTTQLQETEDSLLALADESEKVESRYLARFGAMEVAITQLKSTGTYLTNLVAQWNKSD